MQKQLMLEKIKRLPGFEGFDENLGFLDKDGNNALIAAAKHQDSELALAIIKSGEVDMLQKNNMGDTALKFFVIGNKLETIKAYINAGGNINASMYYNFTALMLASYRGMGDVVKLLLANGADISAVDNEGYNCLMHAAMNGHLDVFRTLIDAGADRYINHQNQWGNTALIEATIHSQDKMIIELLDLGADKNIVNEAGLTASDAALSLWLEQEDLDMQAQKALEIKLLFREYPAENIELIKLIKAKDTKGAIQLLKEQGDTKDWDGNSGYDWAMYKWTPQNNPEKALDISQKIKHIFNKYQNKENNEPEKNKG